MKDVNPLQRYLAPLRRWWMVLAGALVIGLVATWVTLPEPPSGEGVVDPDAQFRATHVLLRTDDSPTAVSFDLVMLLARQGELTTRVVERMGGEVTSSDVEAIAIAAEPSIGTLSITAVQSTAEAAVELTEVYAEELNELLAERAATELQSDLRRQRELVANLEGRINEVQEEVSPLPEGSLDRRLLEAELEDLLGRFAAEQAALRDLESREAAGELAFGTLQEPVGLPADADDVATLALPQSPVARFGILGLLALLVGVAIVMAIDRLDTFVRTKRDAEEAFGLPVIAQLPRRSTKERESHPIPVLGDSSGVTAEAFRSLRLAVLRAPKWQLSRLTPSSNGSVGTVAPVPAGSEPQALVVSSPLMGDGKSTVVANLAASFAESGQQVLVLDCDFRRPAVGAILGVNGAGVGLRGLTRVGEKPLEELCVATMVDGVRMVPAGEAGIAPPWFMTDCAELVAEARELADVVLFDTGPLSLTNEAVTLVPAVDTAIVVVRANKATWAQGREAVDRLARVGANVAGLVFVGGDAPRRYGYYEQSPEQQLTASKAAFQAKAKF